MVHRASVRFGSGSGDRGATPGNLPRVPASAEARELLDRPGYGPTDEPEEQRLAGRPNMKSIFPSCGVSRHTLLPTLAALAALLSLIHFTNANAQTDPLP